MPARFLLGTVAALVLLATPAAAQRPVFEPDDFIDPGMLTGNLFISRLVVGGVWNQTDHFRPIGGDAGLVILTNSLYVDRYQFDYKHTEFLDRQKPGPLQRCGCSEPIYFPTPPPAGATPAGPPGQRSDTLQLAFYRTDDAARAPVTRRYRVSWSREEIDTVVVSPATGRRVEHRSGHDQSFTFDADTHFSIRGRDVWGSLYFARASRSGTVDKRAQNELAYVSRFPGWAAGPLLFRAKLTVGAISGRGATGLNLINPYFETFWRHDRTKANFHFVWSAERMRSGLEGWRTNHQIAVFLDRTLYLKMFGR